MFGALCRFDWCNFYFFCRGLFSQLIFVNSTPPEILVLLVLPLLSNFHFIFVLEVDLVGEKHQKGQDFLLFSEPALAPRRRLPDALPRRLAAHAQDLRRPVLCATALPLRLPLTVGADRLERGAGMR